jgi:hypothetical protein
MPTILVCLRELRDRLRTFSELHAFVELWPLPLGRLHDVLALVSRTSNLKLSPSHHFFVPNHHLRAPSRPHRPLERTANNVCLLEIQR